MIPDGNIVKEFMMGPTKVKICDDYCRDKTPDEVQQILSDIAKAASAAIRNASETAYARIEKPPNGGHGGQRPTAR